MAGKRLTAIARRLRRDMTDAERLLWSQLRSSQLDGRRFVRQFPIGSAVADFACRSAKPAIELDGGQHVRATEADRARTTMMEAHGYRVIRFWNGDVMSNLDGVLARILLELEIASNR